LTIDAYLVAASIGRNESQAFDLCFKFLQQFICQAHGLVGIVSDRTVSDLDLHHGGISSGSTPKIILLLTQIRRIDFLPVGRPQLASLTPVIFQESIEYAQREQTDLMVAEPLTHGYLTCIIILQIIPIWDIIEAKHGTARQPARF
jgi:hypothetical protein